MVTEITSSSFKTSARSASTEACVNALFRITSARISTAAKAKEHFLLPNKMEKNFKSSI